MAGASKWDKIAGNNNQNTQNDNSRFAPSGSIVEPPKSSGFGTPDPDVAIDSVARNISSAANLADKVKAKFQAEGDFAGGSVNESVANALGPQVAAELGLSHGESYSHSIGGPGMGGSSSSPEDEEE